MKFGLIGDSMKIKKKNIGKIIYAGLWILSIGLYLLSLRSRVFSDLFRERVFSPLSSLYARFSGLFSFSIGEWMLILGVMLTFLFALAVPVRFILWCGDRRSTQRRHSQEAEKTVTKEVKKSGTKASEDRASGKVTGREKAARILRSYCRIYVRILAIVVLIMVSNCYILYHASSFRELYLAEQEKYRPVPMSEYSGSAAVPWSAEDHQAAGAEGEETTVTQEQNSGERKEAYGIRELAILREYVIRQADALAGEMERDEKGYLISPYTADEMEQMAGIHMRKLGETYPLLAGFYPSPKQFTFSDFFSQQYMMGYYFPFSMEANYNSRMYISNVPATLCHELSHLKGFIYEDDASFIGYLACISSEDPFFAYSGYLSVLGYLNNDLYRSLGEDQELYSAFLQPTELVKRDKVFLTKEAWEEVEKKAVISTETLHKASDAFLDTNQKLNGIEDGIAVYGNVVQRLLEYYDGVLY